MDLITLDDIEFAYGRQPVLRSLNLTVQEGRITVLVGQSGSGKSTVLRLIAGLEAPRRGTVLIANDVVSHDRRAVRAPEERGVAMVFQDLALWPHMTVCQTLDFVLGRGLSAQERRERIAETLLALGLDGRAEARPAELSGGEQQRLALARAIISRPRIVLMDEPLANLDTPRRLALLEEIRRVRERFGLTILYVTHNQQETFILGDCAAVLHEGRVLQSGPPRALYERPASAFVASLMGRCALLPAVLKDGRAETALGPLTAVGHEGDTVRVVIRPEDVILDPNGPFAGRVERATFVGGTHEVEITGPGWRIWSVTREEPRIGAILPFAITHVSTVPQPIGDSA